MFNNVNTFDLIKGIMEHCDYSDEMKQLKNALEWIHKSRQTTSYSTSVMLFENVFAIKISLPLLVPLPVPVQVRLPVRALMYYEQLKLKWKWKMHKHTKLRWNRTNSTFIHSCVFLSFIFFVISNHCNFAVSFSTRQKFSLYPHDLFLLIVRTDEKETGEKGKKESKITIAK